MDRNAHRQIADDDDGYENKQGFINSFYKK